MSDVWEPVSFEVGQRVQVLSRPECHYCRESPDETGLIGVIESVGPRSWQSDDPDTRAHRFWVEFPEPVPSHGCRWSHFAACELIPLPDAASPAPAEGARS